MMRHLDFNWVYLAGVVCAMVVGVVGLYCEHLNKQYEFRTRLEMEKRPCSP